MKKFFFSFVFLFFISNGLCATKPVFVVSIAPYKGLVQELAGDTFQVYSLLKEGQDPHSFEFKPSTVAILQKARAYFTVGTELEMEVRLLPRLKKQYKDVLFVNTAKGLNSEDKNPHVWVSLLNIKIIASNIKDSLIELYPEKKNIFIENYKKNISKIEKLLADAVLKFAGHNKQIFLTYHPAFEYFAKDFDLIERSVEDYGRAPSAKDLQKLTNLVKEKSIGAIVVRKGTNRGVLLSFIERNHLKSIELDYLSEDYIAALRILVEQLPAVLK